MIVSFWCGTCRKNAYVTLGPGPVHCIACGGRDLEMRKLTDNEVHGGGNNNNGGDVRNMRHVQGCKPMYAVEAARVE